MTIVSDESGIVGMTERWEGVIEGADRARGNLYSLLQSVIMCG